MSSVKLLGERIKNCRLGKGMTQEALSEAIGVSLKYIQEVEGDREVPSIELFSSIADTLQVAPGQLLSDDESVSQAYPNLSANSISFINDVSRMILEHISQQHFPREMFGKRISDARDAAGLSRKELASRVGISVASLGRIECGTQFTTVKTLLAIQQELNFPIEYFLQDISMKAAQERLSDSLSLAKKELTADEYPLFNNIINNLLAIEKGRIPEPD